MSPRRWKGWAVDLRIPGHASPSLAGRYYFGSPSEWMRGHVIAVFETKRAAERWIGSIKEQAKRQKRIGPRVVRVSVSLRAEP